MKESNWRFIFFLPERTSLVETEISELKYCRHQKTVCLAAIDHEKQSSRCETQSSQQCGECRILYYKYLLRSSIIESRKFACHTIFSKVFISTRYVFIQSVCTFYTNILDYQIDLENVLIITYLYFWTKVSLVFSIVLQRNSLYRTF